jgi:class 3 adenylate cyclase
MADLPRGTVTFLFTDIEGSTALWERDRQAMASVVARHLALLDVAISAQGGVHFKNRRRRSASGVSHGSGRCRRRARCPAGAAD